MTISGIGTDNASTVDTSTRNQEVVGKQDFMNLLITQLQYQDPLNPMDSTEFTAQLAQFTSLEELINVNENLKNLESYQASINNSQAVSFIGKNVDALGDTIQMDGGVSSDIRFRLPENASSVVVNIYSPNNDFVRSMDMGALGDGDHGVAWDGRDSAGNKMPDGSYTFEVLAADRNGNTMDAVTFITTEVQGVTFKDGNAYLTAKGYEIPISHVMTVSNK